jgi:hypothetical protein
VTAQATLNVGHGKITEVDTIRGYVEALGGTVDVVARVGDWTSGRMSVELKCVVIACIVGVLSSSALMTSRSLSA